MNDTIKTEENSPENQDSKLTKVQEKEWEAIMNALISLWQWKSIEDAANWLPRFKETVN